MALLSALLLVAYAAVCAVPCRATTTTTDTAPVVISGVGKFRYQYTPTKLVLPTSVQLLNGHGLTRDKAGNIYFTYESLDKTSADVRALIRFNPDGTNGQLLGDAALAQVTHAHSCTHTLSPPPSIPLLSQLSC
jgi:hypothetical protein